MIKLCECGCGMEVKEDKRFITHHNFRKGFWEGKKRVNMIGNTYRKGYSGAKSGSWKGGQIIKSCIVCNKEFKVYLYRKDTAKFCSHECHSKYLIGKPNGISKKTDEEKREIYNRIVKKRKITWDKLTKKERSLKMIKRRRRVILTCIRPECKKEFEVQQCFKDRKYCSHRCQMEHMKILNKGHIVTEETKMKIAEAHSKIFKWGHRTEIENIMERALRNEGINIIPQKRLLHFVVDFFIPKSNIVIEADGDYWHNYPDGTERDRYKTEKLENAGYLVLRFWERDIHKNIEECIAIVIDAIDRLEKFKQNKNEVNKMEQKIMERGD